MTLSENDKTAFRALIEGSSTLPRPDRSSLLDRASGSAEPLPDDLAAIVRGPMAYTVPETTTDGFANPPTGVTPPTSYGLAANLIRGRLSVPT